MIRAKRPGKPPRTVERRRLVAERSDMSERIGLRDRVVYTGNPMHKRSPGDFELNPPAAARPNKTLCDAAGIFRKRIARALLRKGALDGLWDELKNNGYPKIVWCVVGPSDKDALEDDVGQFKNELDVVLRDHGQIVLEAQLESAELGHYHGYPLLESDSYRDVVLERYARFTQR